MYNQQLRLCKINSNELLSVKQLTKKSDVCAAATWWFVNFFGPQN